MSKAAHSTIPRGVRTMYVPCMDEEAQALLDEYEKSGDPDTADHLIESLDAARRARCEESPAKMHFTHSSQKSWALLRRLGAAQRPPQSARPPVSAKKSGIPSHPGHQSSSKQGFQTHSMRRMAPGTSKLYNISSSSGISPGELVMALGRVKLGTAPGYDLIHPQFLKHLVPKHLFG